MLGSAVMTTDASRTIIRYVARITPSTSEGWGRADAPGAGSARRARPVKTVPSKVGPFRPEEVHLNRRSPPRVSEGASGSCSYYSGGSLRFVKFSVRHDHDAGSTRPAL